MRRKIPFLLNLVTVLVILGVIALIGLQVVNDTVEKEVAGQLESFVSSSGMEDHVSYSDITMDAVNGKISMSDVDLALEEQQVMVKAGLLEVILIPGEIVKAAVNAKTGALSRAQVNGSSIALTVADSDLQTSMDSLNLTVTGEVGQSHLKNGDAKVSGAEAFATNLAVRSREQGVDLSFGSVSIATDGDFSQKALEGSDARIHHAVITAEDMRSVSADSGMVTEIGSLEATVDGDVKQALLNGDLSVLFETENTIQLTLRDTTASIDQSVISETDLMGFESVLGAFLQDVSVEELSLDMATSPDTLDVKNIALDSSILSGTGAMKAALNSEQDMESVDFSMEVESLDAGIKSMVGPIFAFMGNPIPAEGPFTFSYSVSPEGGVQMLIE